MKIAIVTPGTLPVPAIRGGAVETLIELLIKGNENDKDNDNDITIYSIFDERSALETKKYLNTKFFFINDNTILFKLGKIIRYFLKSVFKINISSEYLSRIIRDIKKNDFDLIVIENRPDFVLNIKKYTTTKIIQHIHNDYLSEESNTNRKIVDYSDKIIVVSEYLKNELKWYNNNSKIQTLYNSIDINNFNKNILINETVNLKKELNILSNEMIVLYIGRLTAQKGVSDLIQAFKSINHKNVKLLIVGSSWYSETKKTSYVKDLIAQSEEINEKIIFTGYITYDKLPIVYKIADLVVIPSAGVEAAGLVALEARAAGKPVISSDSGGLPEYIDNKGIVIKRDDNFVRNLSDSMESLLRDECIRKKYSNISLEGIFEFDSHNYYYKFNEIIKDWRAIYEES